MNQKDSPNKYTLWSVKSLRQVEIVKRNKKNMLFKRKHKEIISRYVSRNCMPEGSGLIYLNAQRKI